MAIEYTGLRPGEKLYKELFHYSEALESTQHEKILQARIRKFEWQALIQLLDDIERASHLYQHEGLYHGLKLLVPEFQYKGQSESSHVQAVAAI